jgi:acyl-CoA synthetase (AMP-forming)/AMP-acid ligase II
VRAPGTAVAKRLRHAAALGGKPAVIDAATGDTLSYAELAAAAESFEAGLAARGFGRGSVLAILAPNIPEYPVVFHGAALAGGAVTTLNPLWKAGEIAGQLRSSQARWLVTVPALADTAKAAGDGLEIIVVGRAPIPGTVPYSSLLAGSAAPAPAIDPTSDLVALPYSSGTTGLPKGVMLTHRNLLASLAVLDSVIQLSEDDVALAVLPFFHIYGMNVIMNPALAAGATMVTMARFELGALLRAIEQHRVTVLYAVPPIVNALARHPAVASADLSSLQWIMSAAAPLDAGTASACARRVGCRVFQAYGMTEASPAVTASPIDAARRCCGTTGAPAGSASASQAPTVRLCCGPKLRPQHPITPGPRARSGRFTCSEAVVRGGVEPPTFRFSGQPR